MLSPLNLPRTNGVPVGRYRLLFQKRSAPMLGVQYSNGRAKRPVNGIVVIRHRKAFGAGVTVEPWDVATAERCLAYYEGKEDKASADLVREWLAANAAPTEGEGEKPDDLDDLEVEALHALAKERGLSLHPRTGKEKVLVALREQAAKVAAETKPADATTPAEGEKSDPEEGSEGDDAEKGDEPTE